MVVLPFVSLIRENTIGPFSDQQLRDLADDGQILPTDIVAAGRKLPGIFQLTTRVR
jgi:hypothetical protein